MRTTVTLNADTELIVRQRMRERGETFKEALNDLIRQAVVNRAEHPPFETETASMGESTVNLDRALQVSAGLEDDELLRRIRSNS
jgi:hypothetical protein